MGFSWLINGGDPNQLLTGMILEVLQGRSPHGALNQTTEASGKHFSEALRGRPTAIGGGEGVCNDLNCETTWYGHGFGSTGRWWQLKDFEVSSLFGEDEPILTSIFFRWVGSTTN